MRFKFLESSLKWAFIGCDSLEHRELQHALAQLGHDVEAYEPCVPEDVDDILEHASQCDVIVKASRACEGLDDEIDASLISLRRWDNLVVYWDGEPLTTITDLRNDACDPRHVLLRGFDLILVDGGETLASRMRDHGARDCLATQGELAAPASENGTLSTAWGLVTLPFRSPQFKMREILREALVASRKLGAQEREELDLAG